MQEPKRFLGLWKSGRDALAGMAGLAGAGLLLVLGGWQLIPGAGNPFGGESYRGPCRHQPTAPLSAAQVLSITRAHGYDMGSRESDVLCKSDSVSSRLTNAVDASKPTPANVHSYGYLTCLVEEAPILDTAERVTIRRQDGKTTAYVDNVECILYTDGDGDDAERQLNTFDQMVNALARSA